ncbi:MAG: hydrogenase maturation nickel metallochaperone HypA [Anaerolineales bacterium]
MHELAVTESLLEIVLRRAAPEAASRVTDLHLVIDQLSSIVDDSIQFYWDFISAGTIAEGARLHFERRPASVLCQDCGHTFDLARELGPCPGCGSDHIRIVSGSEFRLDSIEIEIAEKEASLP